MAGEDLVELRGRQQPAGHLLVIDAAFDQIFRRMAVGSVADVVHQRRDPHQPPLAAAGRGGEPSVALGRQRVVDPPRQVHGAEDVAEAAVLGAGEDQVGHAELADVAQTLHRPAVEQRRLQLVGADEAVDGVADREQGAASGRPEPGRSSTARSCCSRSRPG